MQSSEIKSKSLMADPMNALRSYQQALDAGMPVDPSELDGDYLKRNGEVSGAMRFDFLKIIDGEAIAIAMFVEDEPHNDVARYSLAYAVNENHRRRGLAIEVVNKGIEDLKKKFGQVRMKRFFVEAVIDKTNVPSINVAKQVLLGPGIAITDSETGTPALLFYRLIQLSTAQNLKSSPARN